MGVGVIADAGMDLAHLSLQPGSPWGLPRGRQQTDAGGGGGRGTGGGARGTSGGGRRGEGASPTGELKPETSSLRSMSDTRKAKFRKLLDEQVLLTFTKVPSSSQDITQFMGTQVGVPNVQRIRRVSSTSETMRACVCMLLDEQVPLASASACPTQCTLSLPRLRKRRS